MFTWLSILGLVLAWIVYPAVVRILASRRSDSRPPVGTAPFISIILATREDDAAIHRRVENCLSTSYDRSRLEIIVAVDAACPTAPSPALESSTDVQFVRGDAPGGKAATLNAAVRASRGDVLVFGDTHQQFTTDTLKNLVRPLADTTIGAVSGSLELTASTSAALRAYWSFERALRANEAKLHSSVGVTGAVWAMRSALWEPLPPRLILDDLFTPMRLVLGGWRVAFAEDARATELRTPSPGQEYRRKVRTLTGVLQVCAWLPRALSPRRNPIFVQFVTHKLLRLLTPYWFAVAFLGLVALGVRTAGLPLLAGAGALVLAAIAVAPRGPARLRRFREILANVILLQAAAVVGTIQGMRQQWNVWR